VEDKLDAYNIGRIGKNYTLIKLEMWILLMLVEPLYRNENLTYRRFC
jgi:hypothetical protein